MSVVGSTDLSPAIPGEYPLLYIQRSKMVYSSVLVQWVANCGSEKCRLNNELCWYFLNIVLAS